MRLPEREFFYKVLYKLHPETVDELIRQAYEHRKPKPTNLQEQQWSMCVKPEWMDQLLLYDYTSCKYLTKKIVILFLRYFREEGKRPEQSPNLTTQTRCKEKKAKRRHY